MTFFVLFVIAARCKWCFTIANVTPMKTTAFIAFAVFLPIACFVPRLPAQDLHPAETRGPVRTVTSDPEPWSVAGQWHYAGPAGRGMIDLRTDGTFSRAGDGQTGEWKLGAAGDNFVLILSWKNFPRDMVALISPALFHADSSKGEIIVRRLAVVSQAAPAQPVPHSAKKSDFVPGDQITF